MLNGGRAGPVGGVGGAKEWGGGASLEYGGFAIGVGGWMHWHGGDGGGLCGCLHPVGLGGGGGGATTWWHAGGGGKGVDGRGGE